MMYQNADLRKFIPLLTTTLLLMFAPIPVEGEEFGIIEGQLLDDADQPLGVRNAFAFLCDAKTGFPLRADTKQVISRSGGFGPMNYWWSAKTDNDGRFTFDHVPPGKYRIVAQSWTGLDAIPSMKANDVAVTLHGFADNVTVETMVTSNCTVKALGSSVLQIQNQPNEGNAFLFVSLKPTLGEPILGPMLWGNDFTRNVVSAVHIKRGSQTFFGLPNNAEVHVMLLNYDNNAGLGGVTVKTNRYTKATLPIYATWSNGYHEPPQRLKPLVEWVRAHPQQGHDLIHANIEAPLKPKPGQPNNLALLEHLKQSPDVAVDVPGLGKFSKLELLAAQNYLRILESHEARKSERNQSK